MPSADRNLITRIVDRLAEMAADADYAQRRLFEIRTGIDLSDRPVRRAHNAGRHSRGARTTGGADTPTA